jgi:hypothetical protein
MKMQDLSHSRSTSRRLLQEQTDINQLIAQAKRNDPNLGRLVHSVTNSLALGQELTAVSEMRLFMLFRPLPGEPLVSHTADPVTWGPIPHTVDFQLYSTYT